MYSSIIRAVEMATGTVIVASKTTTGVHRLAVGTMGELLGSSLDDIRRIVDESLERPPTTVHLKPLPPIDGACEVWAAGVTYERSRQARVEESEVEDVYDRVYAATRPELFFKCAAWRAVTDHEPIAVRLDSDNDTPEPELGLVVNAGAEVVGYVVVNDMSSRAIEGENPLYLPQAKIYDGACAISPNVTPVWSVGDPRDLTIRLAIERQGATVFEGTASTAQLQRTPNELVEYLFHSNTFPEGAVLSTGTSLVPPIDKPTRAGDVVAIAIDEVGKLKNPVTTTNEVGPWLRERMADPLAPPPEV
jgi:2-dehydro-3-deoxy-D-arabinonate dehydratase